MLRIKSTSCSLCVTKRFVRFQALDTKCKSHLFGIALDEVDASRGCTAVFAPTFSLIKPQKQSFNVETVYKLCEKYT